MVVLTLTAAAAPYALSDAGRPRPTHPAALVVCTPGMPLSAYAPLVDALESAGLDAWTLSFPPEAQDAAAISGQWLPQVVEQLSADRRIAVVGEGLGGTLAALSVDARAIQPDALALLGSPLRTEPVGLYDWLATLPPPAEDLSLSAVSDASWRGMGVLELMLGAPMPTLEAVSAAWLTQLQAWTGGGLSVDLRDDGVPVWAAASGLDNLAPPEWVRPAVPPTAFFRFGYLRFEPEDPDHLGLISSPRALRMLSRWAATTLRTP